MDMVQYRKEQNKIVFHIGDNVLVERPTLYQHSDGSLYMIQNVDEGFRQDAAYVSRYWIKNKINLGFHAKNPSPTVVEDEEENDGVREVQLAKDLFLDIEGNGIGINEVCVLKRNVGMTPYFSSLVKIF